MLCSVSDARRKVRDVVNHLAGDDVVAARGLIASSKQLQFRESFSV
jgi:hypothetical protein